MNPTQIQLLTSGPDNAPHGRNIVYVPQAQIGDGAGGPPNDQQLQIFRDTRPIATDELEGPPFHMSRVARHRAGRTFPLNFSFGAWFDPNLPYPDTYDRPQAPSPLYWGQSPQAHIGTPPVEVIPGVNTIYYTATPEVGP